MHVPFHHGVRTAATHLLGGNSKVRAYVPIRITSFNPQQHRATELRLLSHVRASLSRNNLFLSNTSPCTVLYSHSHIMHRVAGILPAEWEAAHRYDRDDAAQPQYSPLWTAVKYALQYKVGSVCLISCTPPASRPIVPAARHTCHVLFYHISRLQLCSKVQ